MPIEHLEAKLAEIRSIWKSVGVKFEETLGAEITSFVLEGDIFIQTNADLEMLKQFSFPVETGLWFKAKFTSISKLSKFLDVFESKQFLVRIHKSTINPNLLSIFSDFLKTTQTLKHMVFWSQHSDHKAGAKIAHGLRLNESLISFEFARHCKVDMSSAAAIANSLRENKTMKELKFQECEIQNQGGVAFANMLRKNETLKVLALPYCNIGENGCVAIVKAMMENEFLEELNIEGNKFGTRTCRAISEMLKVNTSLKKLRMGYRDFGGDSSFKVIEKGLNANETLKYLSLDCADCSVGYVRQLQAKYSDIEIEFYDYAGDGDMEDV